jgi:hypothetical protein
VPERADELFVEYAEAYARGERPVAAEFLARAGEEVDDLAVLIDGFLDRAPAPVLDEQAVALFDAWQTGESPLARLRIALGLERDAVASMVIQALGLDPNRERKVARYYNELERGQLDPAHVDRRVWEALAQTLRARVTDLVAWRPPPLALSDPVFGPSAAVRTMTVMRPHIADEGPEDEIDRLFRSGGGES